MCEVRLGWNEPENTSQLAGDSRCSNGANSLDCLVFTSPPLGPLNIIYKVFSWSEPQEKQCRAAVHWSRRYR